MELGSFAAAATALGRSPQMRVNDAQALLATALAGFGIVVMPYDLARTALDAGRLIRILPDFETSSRPMHLLFRPDRRQTPKLRSFIDTTLAAFPPD